MPRVPTKGLVAGKGAAPRRAPAPARKPAAADKDRERRAFDLAARRVPVWQVSAVTVLKRLHDARPAGGDELPVYKRMAEALAQVPPEVLRAAELHMRGEWKRA